MKLLVALLLVLCLFNSVNSTCYNTLKTLSGYSSGTSSVGYNVNIDENGQVQKQSYIENAIMNVDFTTQQIQYTISTVQQDGQPINYDLYLYGSNQTQYISVVGKCYTLKFDEPVPSSLPIVPSASSFVIGDIQTETYEIKTNTTTQIVNVNPSSCALLVAFVENTSDDFGGNTIFINYSTTVNSSVFTLPSVCYNAAPIQKEHNFKLKSRFSLI